MRSTGVLCRDKSKEEVESLIGCRYVSRSVVTQLGRGLDVVYFCPFAGTVPLDDVL